MPEDGLDALLTGSSVFVIVDYLTTGMDVLLSVSGEIFSLGLVYLQIDQLIDPVYVGQLRWVLFAVSLLYLTVRIDRLYRELKSETNDD